MRQTISDAQVYRLTPIIQQCAAKVKLPPSVSREDAEQQAWEFILRRPRHWDSEDSLVALAISRDLWKWARRERAREGGYRANDQASYDRDFILAALPIATDESRATWADKPMLDGYDPEIRSSGKSDPAKGGTYLVSMMDVAWAWQRLAPRDREVLTDTILDGRTLEALAAEHGVASSTVANWRDKAIQNMIDFLGGSPLPKDEPEQSLGYVERYATKQLRNRASALYELAAAYDG